MKLTFLGAVGTVTGSKYLIDAGDTRVLVDCGLFQGYKNLRLRNWAPLPVDPATIKSVILTHAHIDHSGYLPLLVKNGFKGPVYCTGATHDLCALLLPDSGFLQERDAEFANRHKFSKHRPALPLYTREDAERSLQSLRAMEFGQDYDLGAGLTLSFARAGHILGAALVRLSQDGVSVQFSGDLGRPEDPLMPPPAAVRQADYLVVESTYGDRRHDSRNPQDILAEIVNTTAARGGAVIIPAFAVGRTQSLLYHLHHLKAAGRIPNVPVFLDSPMAIDASEIYCQHQDDHRLSASACRNAFNVATYVHSVEDSKALDGNTMPMVLISASGMATGGRVLHHLKHFLPDPRNTIVFAGFQAGGTRGAALVAGAEAVKIHGAYVPAKAEIRSLSMFSAHADADEIIGWLQGFERAPRRTFVTHGEPAAADTLRHRVEEELGWTCHVPEYRDQTDLD
jgi:metallo-beta-lactamase family protein